MTEVSQITSPWGWEEVSAGTADNNPKSVEAAARQFEALMIGQMLKGAREAGSSEGWLGTGEDSSGTSVMEFAEQQFAQLMAAGGGMGLAKMVVEHLEPAPMDQLPSPDAAAGK